MASRKNWHLPLPEEADWLRLLLFENEVENIKDSKVPFHPTPGSTEA